MDLYDVIIAPKALAQLESYIDYIQIKLSQLAVLYNSAESTLIDAKNHCFCHHNDTKSPDTLVFRESSPEW